MNNSFKESGDFQTIAEWFRKHPFPHCKTVTNLSTLRTGIACNIQESLLLKY